MINKRSLKTAAGDEPEKYQEVEGLEKPQKILHGEKDVSAKSIEQEIITLSEISTMVQYARAYPDDLPTPATDAELAQAKADKSKELMESLIQMGNEETLAELRVLGERSQVDFSTLKSELTSAIDQSGLISDEFKQALKDLSNEASIDASKVTGYVKACQEQEQHRFVLEMKREKLNAEKAAVERMQLSNQSIDETQKVVESWHAGISKWVGMPLTAVGLGVAIASPPVGIGIAGASVASSLLSKGMIKLTGKTWRWGRKLRNRWSQFKAFVSGKVRKAEKEATAKEQDFLGAKEKYDEQVSELDKSLKHFEEAKRLAEGSLRECSSQLQATQREMASKMAAGELYIDQEDRLKDLGKEQQRLQTVVDRLNMNITAYQKLKKDAINNVTVEDIQRFWYDSNEEGLQAAIKNFANHSDEKTREAQKTVSESSYEDAREEMERLRFGQLDPLARYFRSRELPSEPTERKLKGLKDNAPQLHKVLTSLPQMAGKTSYKETVYQDLREHFQEIKKDAESARQDYRRKLREFFQDPASGGHPHAQELLKADVLRQVAEQVIDQVEGGENIDLDELFPKNFRSLRELKKHLRKDLSIPEVRLIQKMLDALSGSKPTVVLSENGTVEEASAMKQRLERETKTVYDKLSDPIKTALSQDLSQITSIDIKDFPDTDRQQLPSAAVATDFNHYLEICNTEQLQVLQKFLKKIRERGAVYGRNRIVDFENLKRFEIVDLMGDIENLPSRRGLDGAVQTVLKHPIRLKVALDYLQRFGGHIGGRQFSAGFTAIENQPFDSEWDFVEAVDDQDDLALIADIFRNMEGNLITTPFEMRLDPTQRIKQTPEDFSFYSIEAAVKDIQGDIKDILKVIGTDDITQIDAITIKGQDIMPTVFAGITTPGGNVRLDGQALDDESNWSKLPYLLLSMDNFVKNLESVGTPPHAIHLDPAAPQGTIRFTEIGGLGRTVEGEFYSKDGTFIA